MQDSTFSTKRRFHEEPLVSKINRLMRELEEHINCIQGISVELSQIVEEEKNQRNDWR